MCSRTTLFRISPTWGPPQIPGRPSPEAQGGSGSPLGPRGAACRVSLPGRAGERREGAGRRASQKSSFRRGKHLQVVIEPLALSDKRLNLQSWTLDLGPWTFPRARERDLSAPQALIAVAEPCLAVKGFRPSRCTCVCVLGFVVDFRREPPDAPPERASARQLDLRPERPAPEQPRATRVTRTSK